MRQSAIVHLTLLLFFFSTQPGSAKSFYIDPLSGSMANDGSAAKPWSTLQAVFDSNRICSRKYETKPATATTPFVTKNPTAPVKSGDTLLCRSGYHGALFASEYYNENWITIMAFPGDTPKIASMELRSGCRWRIKGFLISPSFAPAYKRSTLINFASHNWTGESRECIAEGCTGYSVPDASLWTKEQWDTLSCNAISLPGNAMTVRDNVFKNVNFGISVTGDSCCVENNVIENFAGDGMRGLGDYDIFQYNTVKNCYAVNANHDDGFQSWSVGDSGNVGTGVVYGIILRGNTIINYEDPNQPFRGTLQGIGCFDGMFENWRIENNVIITDHWHGITLYGAVNCIVINNTVVDINTTEPGPPWISISEHKNGQACSGCIVRNNLTTDINCTNKGVTIDHNITIAKYEDFFVNYAAKNLHLLATCSAVDAGTTDGAPFIDRDALGRPAGAGIDIGAYEYGATAVHPRTTARSAKYFLCNYERGSVIASLPSGNGTLTLFDLSGRAFATVTCARQSNAIVPVNKQATQYLLAKFQTAGTSYYTPVMTGMRPK